MMITEAPIQEAEIDSIAAPAPAPEPEEEVFVFPATAAQRRFWLLDQMAPGGGNPALNMPIAARLNGALQRTALERAFAEVVARHEAPRTTFHEEKGQLRQVIAPVCKTAVPLVDVLDFPEAERGLVADHLIREEAETPFDLARGPLCRARLVRLSSSEHLLLITLHHIICDGWSNGLILRELGELYTAYAKGEAPPLPPLPLQFADFADWQTQALSSGGLEEQFNYWKKQLAGELPTLALPGSHAPKKRASGRGGGGTGSPAAIRWKPLPTELAKELKTLGARESASAYMVFLAGFYALLHRTARGEPTDIIVSTPSANRTRAEVEGLVGLFVNPLLLRTNLADATSFRDLLTRVRRTVLDAFANADAPFEWIIDEIKPRRLQVNFIFQQAFLQPARLPDLTLTPLPSVSGGAVFEWTAGAIEDADGVRLCLEYNTDLFAEADIDRTLDQYRSVLEAVVARPDAPLCDLLPKSEEAEELGSVLDETLTQPATESLSDEEKADVEKHDREGVPYLTVHYQLLEIWQELLEVKHIGIKDDFFALGGNSLLALQMLRKMEQVCGRALLPAALFKQATIEHLANALVCQEEGKSPAILTIQDKGEKTPLFYLHGDLTGGGYYCMKLSRGLGENQPFYALPPVDVNAVNGLPSIEQMAAMHVAAIRGVKPHGPYALGGFCLGGLIAYEVAQQLVKAGETVERLIIIDATVNNGRFRRLRGLAEWLGKRRGLDEDGQLYLFCRAHFFLARLKRWGGLGVREQGRIFLHRAHCAWQRVRGEKAGPQDGMLPPSESKVAKVEGAEEEGTGKAVAADWYDPRWDAPLVFLWATGGYRARRYEGPATLLLSRDLTDGTEDNPAQDWKRCAPKLEVHQLPGSHLACITEHVDELAMMVGRILQQRARMQR